VVELTEVVERTEVVKIPVLVNVAVGVLKDTCDDVVALNNKELDELKVCSSPGTVEEVACTGGFEKVELGSRWLWVLVFVSTVFALGAYLRFVVELFLFVTIPAAIPPPTPPRTMITIIAIKI
jgi:hypothetical protein